MDWKISFAALTPQTLAREPMEIRHNAPGTCAQGLAPLPVYLKTSFAALTPQTVLSAATPMSDRRGPGTCAQGLASLPV